MLLLCTFKDKVSVQYHGFVMLFNFLFFSNLDRKCLACLTVGILCGLNQGILQKGLNKLKTLEMNWKLKRGSMVVI